MFSWHRRGVSLEPRLVVTAGASSSEPNTTDPTPVNVTSVAAVRIYHLTAGRYVLALRDTEAPALKPTDKDCYVVAATNHSASELGDMRYGLLDGGSPVEGSPKSSSLDQTLSVCGIERGRLLQMY